MLKLVQGRGASFPSLHPICLPIICILALGASPSHSQLVQFFQEEIQIQVLGGSCILTGVYHFRNITAEPVAQELLYPFPARKDLPSPTEVEARDLTTGVRLPVKRVQRGATFTLVLPPRGEVVCSVSYVQPTPAGRMEYPLISTQHWGRPLEHATYAVIVPNGYVIHALSIPADTTWKSSSTLTYMSRKVNFMPTRDLTFRWEKRIRR
jgi:hypothetical protein